MDLPEELKRDFWQEFCEYEEKKHMPFITSVEEIGIEKGRIETLIEAIGMDVELKFPAWAAEIMKLVQALDGVEPLRLALRAIKTAPTPEAFCAALTSVSHTDKS